MEVLKVFKNLNTPPIGSRTQPQSEHRCRPIQASQKLNVLIFGLSLFMLAGCGGGGGSGASSAGGTTSPVSTTTAAVYATPAQESLSTLDVERVLAQAVGEAHALNSPAIIAVTDRVGNVLAVFQMTGARTTMTTSRLTGTNVFNDFDIDAQGIDVDATMGAISKAVTGTYLSSSGNAFSTRTASQIVQQHFPPSPTSVGQEGGPLFGVQFSQLPCSDLNTRYTAGAASDALIGPKRSPLGLAADPGGFPLYKNGVVVGAVGVMADGDYGFDTNILDIDSDVEEKIALAGSQGFAAPDTITADRISLSGTLLRYSDATVGNLHPLETRFSAFDATYGNLIAVRGYTDGTLRGGVAYGAEASGYRRSSTSEFSFPDAFVLTDGSGHNRYPIRAGTDQADVGQALSASEVQTVLEEAYRVMAKARGAIRWPLDSHAQMTISIVDSYGTVLGLVRSPDAPLFGTDVSVQKARTVAFFANPKAEQQLNDTLDAEVPLFAQRFKTFLNDPDALSGKYAFGARSIGNLARPYFPDGELGRPNGPLSRPIADFNPFATGLQVALIKSNLLQHALHVRGSLGIVNDTGTQCTSLPAAPTGQRRLANGIQIFPGAVPIYRGETMVGAIGVSGDGVDQDDMVSFLGLNNAALRIGTISNAPKARRADNIVVPVGSGVRLRYVNCPVAPFLGSSEQNVCSGL